LGSSEQRAATIAGLLIYETDAIPEPGQMFAFHDFRFQVVGKDRNRLTTLKMTPLRIARAPPEICR